jgi:hypothetical protein
LAHERDLGLPEPQHHRRHGINPGFRTIVRDNISYNNITLPVGAGRPHRRQRDHHRRLPVDPDRGLPELHLPHPSREQPRLRQRIEGHPGHLVGLRHRPRQHRRLQQRRQPQPRHMAGRAVEPAVVQQRLDRQHRGHEPAFNSHNTAIGNYSYGGYVNQNIVWENNLTFNGTPGQPSFKTDGGNNAPLAAGGNLLGVNPLFLNAGAFDFRLSPDSPAFGLGWGGIWSGAAAPGGDLPDDTPGETPRRTRLRHLRRTPRPRLRQTRPRPRRTPRPRLRQTRPRPRRTPRPRPRRTRPRPPLRPLRRRPLRRCSRPHPLRRSCRRSRPTGAPGWTQAT